jgi:predicted site-specific integrase-resolvase
MKLSDWAKLQGISYKTAWRWFDQGKLPVPAEQTLTGTILVKTAENNLDCVVYARVSSSDQKTDLDRQIARVVEAVTQQGLTVSKTVTEIGSGFPVNRPKLIIRLLRDSSIKVIAALT